MKSTYLKDGFRFDNVGVVESAEDRMVAIAREIKMQTVASKFATWLSRNCVEKRRRSYVVKQR